MRPRHDPTPDRSGPAGPALDLSGPPLHREPPPPDRRRFTGQALPPGHCACGSYNVDLDGLTGRRECMDCHDTRYVDRTYEWLRLESAQHLHEHDLRSGYS